MHICDMAPMSYMPMGWPTELGIGLEAEATWNPETGPNWPNGTHFTEVEVDPDTGFVDLVRHIAVNDSGEVINPLLLAGQVHGGVAQGVGQALMEDVTYDSDGQILAGSFLDYCMPRADDLPMIETSDFVAACQTNPLGVKAWQSGTVGSIASTVNAIVDALSDYGVTDIEMPATPLKVCAAQQDDCLMDDRKKPGGHHRGKIILERRRLQAGIGQSSGFYFDMKPTVMDPEVHGWRPNWRPSPAKTWTASAAAVAPFHRCCRRHGIVRHRPPRPAFIGRNRGTRHRETGRRQHARRRQGADRRRRHHDRRLVHAGDRRRSSKAPGCSSWSPSSTLQGARTLPGKFG